MIFSFITFRTELKVSLLSADACCAYRFKFFRLDLTPILLTIHLTLARWSIFLHYPRISILKLNSQSISMDVTNTVQTLLFSVVKGATVFYHKKTVSSNCHARRLITLSVSQINVEFILTIIHCFATERLGQTFLPCHPQSCVL